MIIRNWSQLGAGQLDPLAAAREELDLITTTASQAIAEVREIAYNLGPYHLERVGLAGALADMIRRVAEASLDQRDERSASDTTARSRATPK